jgi:endonuclease YncB( thermonuclease family)
LFADGAVMRVILPLLVSSVLAAADSYAVSGVPAGDRLVLQTASGLPLPVSLAHIAVPPAQQDAAQAELRRLVEGNRVELIYLHDFGTDPATGAARVQVLVGRKNLNEELVAGGLASYAAVKPDSASESNIRRAEEKARRAGVGQWAAGNGTALAAAKPAAATTAKPAMTRAAQGPFCSELDNQFYYPTGAREIANVNPQRLIFYPDEATAQKAGKRKPVQVQAVKRGSSETDGDAAFALGKEITSEALDAGNTPARDELYAKAYGELTSAMQIYSALVDQRPDDEKLALKLRDCMQLRYGSVKMRRFH